jgi:hypothetical protein
VDADDRRDDRLDNQSDVLTDFEGNKPGSKIRAPEFEILKH